MAYKKCEVVFISGVVQNLEDFAAEYVDTKNYCKQIVDFFVAGWAASADKRRIIQLSSSWLRFGLSKVRLKLFRRRGFKLTRSTLMFTNCYLKILQNLVHNGKVYLSELSFNRSKLCPGSCVFYLPITDPIKKSIAQQHRLHFKICRDCGSRNSASATKCRKCRGHNLRWKKRELVR